MKTDIILNIIIGYEYSISSDEIAEMTNISPAVVSKLYESFDNTDSAITRDIIRFHLMKNAIVKQHRLEKKGLSTHSGLDVDFGYTYEEVEKVEEKLEMQDYSVRRMFVDDQVLHLLNSGYSPTVIRDLIRIKRDRVDGLEKNIEYDADRTKKVPFEKVVNTLNAFGDFVVCKRDGLNIKQTTMQLGFSPVIYKEFDVYYTILVKNRGRDLIGEIGENKESDELLHADSSSKEKYDKVKELYEQGYKSDDIADMVGVSRSKVSNIFKSLKDTPSEEIRKNLFENQKIETCLYTLKLKRSGMKNTQIAKAMGVSDDVVSKNLNYLYKNMSKEGIEECMAIFEGKQK